MTDRAARVWSAVCRHIDGISVGTTVAALHERGAFDLLAEPVTLGRLTEQLDANAGHLNVAIRLLADQGWVTRRGEPGTDDMIIEPTSTGRTFMTSYALAYSSAVAFLPFAASFDDDTLAPFADLMQQRWGLRNASEQVLAHLDGHLLAPVMYSRISHEPCKQGIRILDLQGWRDGPDGELAAAMARQYRYPMVYLPLLRRVPELIFGAAPDVEPDIDGHFDRELDLKFSGDVFAATCRAPLRQIALRLFDAEPVGAQPALVADMGCGDGALLADLYRGIRDGTARGRVLQEYPLVMVGADPSPVARRITAERLADVGAPHVVLDADVADPQGFADALAARGLDARDALHVCKSSIHDRAYRDAAGLPAAAPPPSDAAYALPDGQALPTSLLGRDLARFFTGWAPLVSRHGWIVIEAHSTPSRRVAGLMGRTLVTALDATHGYSCQYPVEPAVFTWAAARAGLRSRAHREPAAQALGHTLLTIDHFMADPHAR